MPYISITTKKGTLIERIDTTDYDLNKPFARQDLMNDIKRADDLARKWEETGD